MASHLEGLRFQPADEDLDLPEPLGEHPEVTVPHDDPVNHPKHYGAHPSGIECIQITRDMGFSAGNAVKYVWRADLKNGRQDLEKACWYLKDVIDNGGHFYIGTGHLWFGLLAKVADAETDKTRAAFFRAIQNTSPNMALLAVEALLARSF